MVHVVGGAIVDSLERPAFLLAARRTAPPPFAGLWEFPGGKVEPGEGHEAALHRELAEELGVEVRLGHEIVSPARGSSSPEGWPLNAKAVMRVWFAEVVSGVPEALQDHDRLQWIALDDAGSPAEDLPWIPADFPIVEAVRAEAALLRGRGQSGLA
jgi:8-oxo-dGTP diphosphatase